MSAIRADSAETQRLLARIHSGDRQAFGRLFSRHHAYLRKVVAMRIDSKLKARCDPSDVVQETQLEAFRRFDDYLERRPMPFRLWLRKTAEERLLMLHRRHIGAAKRSVARELPLPESSSMQLAQGFLAATPSPSLQFDRGELAALVREAVAELPAIDREILLMRNVEGLSNEEAAQVLSITPATCSQRYGRALIRLQKRLARHGLEGTQP